MKASRLLSRAFLLLVLVVGVQSVPPAFACPQINLDPVTGAPIADPDLQAALEAIEASENSVELAGKSNNGAGAS